MANLKEIRLRIASVKSTGQITSAMKMVSAAKLRKTQSSVQKLRPYSSKMSEIMNKLGSSMSEDIAFARKSKHEENVLLVVLTSNKGLCSNFNSSITKLTVKVVNDLKDKGVGVSVISYGKRGDAALRKLNGIEYLGSNDEIWEKLSFDAVSLESEKFMQDFVKMKYDKILIIYNQFKNAATQIPTVERFLPIENEQDDNNPLHYGDKVAQKSDKVQDYSDKVAENLKHSQVSDYIFSPSKEEIIENIVPLSLHTQMYKCFLDSFASEHGARMTSMNKATDNAQSLLKDLTLTYNKQRQSDITNQIIEVSNGANAV